MAEKKEWRESMDKKEKQESIREKKKEENACKEKKKTKQEKQELWDDLHFWVFVEKMTRRF